MKILSNKKYNKLINENKTLAKKLKYLSDLYSHLKNCHQENEQQVKNKVCQYLNIINYLLRRYKGNKAKIPTDIINEKTQRELVKTTLEDSTIEVKIIEKKEDVNL